MISQNVAVVGLGYVGLPLALLSARKGWQVYGIDIEKSKIDLLNQSISPIADPALQAQLSRAPKDSLHFNTDFTSKILNPFN